jgi:hypothetical protein
MITTTPEGQLVCSCRPTLPPGYGQQEAWGFQHTTGTYEFVRVYGPPVKDGEVCQLDRGRSYWTVLWPTEDQSDEEVPGAWLSYDEAREHTRSRLSFAHFSSPILMRDELPELFSRAQRA